MVHLFSGDLAKSLTSEPSILGLKKALVWDRTPEPLFYYLTGLDDQERPGLSLGTWGYA